MLQQFSPRPAPTSTTDMSPSPSSAPLQEPDKQVVEAPQPNGSSKARNKTSSSSASGSTTSFVKIFSLALADELDEDGDPQFTEIPITSIKFTIKSGFAFRTETKLQDVRVKLERIIRRGQTFKFCVDDCSVVPEDISLEAYSRMLRNNNTRTDGDLLRVYIASTKEPAPSQSSTLLKAPYVLKFIQMGSSSEGALNTGSLHSSAFNGHDPSAMPLGELRRLIGKMSSDSQMHSFCVLDGSAAGDELSLRQYLDLDKEAVHETDGTPSVIIRYRKTEAKVSAAASKFHGASSEVRAAMERMRPDLSFQDRSAEELHMDISSFKVREELDPSHFAARDASPRKFTSQMDEADWDAVLRNCSLLYGWKINKKTNSIERATTPAFRLRANPIVPTHVIPVFVPEIEAQPSTPLGSASSDAPPSYTATETNPEAGPTDTSLGEKAVKPLTAEDVHVPIPTKLGAIPSYVISDQSKIEIVTVSSEFQECMAKNHFSASSIEASVSGGYAGYSAGVTGGVAAESSSGGSGSKKNYSKRIIARYMFPRVTVYLRPEDLEPTQELRDALEKVKKDKNINDLRKLYSTFGQLFSHAATLGGCLQTTKIVEGTEEAQQTKEKEKFKAQVGVAVSTPSGASGSAKGSHENQDSSEASVKNTQTSEAMAFEATGGNTILAADPPSWSGSVTEFQNWRVIDQTELTPLVDAISQMKGFEMARKWFFSAVPKLSQYIVIPESRVMHVRLKIASQCESFDRVTGRKEQAYLGFNPQKPPKPVRSSIRYSLPQILAQPPVITMGPWGPICDMTSITTQEVITSFDAMFEPHSTQAPVLMFPRGKEVGTTLDPKLKQTSWRLEVAQGHALGPDTLVCIKSSASVNSNTPNVPDLALSVYRNAQGVFLPAITSSDEPCYWRFKPVTHSPSAGDRYRHGDTVRLTWSFADQAGGFRDFYGDTYGRRAFGRPPECSSDVLNLKMPFPRFEDTKEDDISLMMSPAMTSDAIIQTIQIRSLDGEKGVQERNYNLHDLTFRLDPIGNGGQGDAGDFMNVITEAHTEISIFNTLFVDKQRFESPMQKLLSEGTPESMVAGVILGPLAKPVGAIASVIGGIFGLF